MADTYTTNLNLTKPEPGAAEDTWGISLNSDLDALDAIFSSSGTQINLNPNQINFADNKKAIFGTGSDLEIYHDGSNSYIDEAGSGGLYIRANSFLTLQKYTGENLAQFFADSEVRLFYDNAQKLATKSTGIDVTGTATMDGLTVDGVARAGSGGVVLTGQYSSSYPNPSANGYFQLKTNNQDANRGGITIARSSDTSGTMLDALRIDYAGDISFYDDTGSTQGLFWDASTESLGIGTTSPDSLLHIKGGDTSIGTLKVQGGKNTVTSVGEVNSRLDFGSNDGSVNSTGNVGGRIASVTEISNGANTGLAFSTFKQGTGLVEYLRLTNDGSVGIGTASPSKKLHVQNGSSGFTGSYNSRTAAIIEGSASNGTALSIMSPSTGVSVIYFGDESQEYSGQVSYDHSVNSMRFVVSGSEKARFDYLGNFGIGTDSPNAKLDVLGADTSGASITWKQGTRHSGYLYSDTSGVAIYDTNLNNAGIYLASNNRMDFRVNGSERMRIDSSGNVGIGVVPSYPLHVGTSGAGIKGFFSNTTDADLTFNLSSGVSLVTPTTGILAFGTASTERMRIDSSGNLLVGKTSAVYNTAGTQLAPDGQVFITGGNQYGLAVNRTTGDGDIVLFSKDGSTVGSIGTASGTLVVGSTNGSGSYLKFGSNVVAPVDVNGTVRDNAIDLGQTNARFKDLHLANQVYINGTTPNIRFTDSDTGADSQITASSGYGALVLKADYNNETAGSYLGFEVDGTEKGRIWSAGLLVGKTTGDFGSTAGSEYRAGGNSYITADNTQPLRLNRLTSDGTLLEFRKDGTTGGVIGVQEPQDNAPELYIANGDGTNNTGLAFWDYIFPTRRISPCNGTGAYVDNLIDLGYSGARFKDLYLSGGVQLGGTGAANKLDDYEEGTWTPVLADATSGGNTATIGSADGTYTKVGKLVTVGCRLADIDTSGMTSSNAIYIRGLPFTVASSTRTQIGAVLFDRINFSGFVTSFAVNSNSYVLLYKNISGANDAALAISDITTTGSDINFTIQYEI